MQFDDRSLPFRMFDKIQTVQPDGFGKCSIKMYDKLGIVLRIETTAQADPSLA